MAEKGGTKPRRQVKDDGGDRADAMQVKVHNALWLREKLKREVVLNAISIPNTKRHRDRDRDHPFIDQHKELAKYLSWEVNYIKNLELEKDQAYYEHHGRVIKKHWSIREQDDIIPNSRRKLMHQRNSLAGEKRLIQDVRLAEETRTKLLTAHCSATDTNTSDSYQETNKNIEYYISRIVYWSLRNKANESKDEGLEQYREAYLKWAEKKLAMMEEVENLISTLEDECILKPELNSKVSWYMPPYRKMI